MAIRIYNTLSGHKEEFEPVTPGKAGIYCCGPTVYSESHIGHMVGPVVFDAVKRYLAYNGYDVSLVINITDVDDKIISASAKTGEPIPHLTERVTKDYQQSLLKLGVHVDHYPHATEHIPHILEMIGKLVDKGFAYPAGGDVYFDVAKDSEYGKLSNRRVEELMAGVRKQVGDLKRSPADFALWKGAKPGEPAWESPWGPGRPGWHIECSAMSMHLLGETFDIHGGGLDLVFPHHEDEIAQSECCSGKPYAKYWMHNGLMQKSDATRKLGARGDAVEGDYESQESAKMSKSKGNIFLVSALLERFRPEEIRFFLLSTHYRRPIDFSEERIEQVAKGLAKFHSFAERYTKLAGEDYYAIEAPATRGPLAFDAEASPFLEEVATLRDQFLLAMDDDFNTGGGIGSLFELLSLLNRTIVDRGLEGKGPNDPALAELRHGVVVLRELTGVLGIVAEAPPEAETAFADELVPQLIDMLLQVRKDLRKAKQFQLADGIRDQLKELGVLVNDSPTGSTWSLEG